MFDRVEEAATSRVLEEPEHLMGAAVRRAAQLGTAESGAFGVRLL